MLWKRMTHNPIPCLAVVHPPIQEVVESGAAVRLIFLMRSDSPALQLEAAWAVTNILSGQSSVTRFMTDRVRQKRAISCFALIQRQGVIPAFVALLESPSSAVVSQAVCCVGCACPMLIC